MIRGLSARELATVREDGEPTRPRAVRAEFSDGEWRLVSEIDIVHMWRAAPIAAD
jgi:hypothetical protein